MRFVSPKPGAAPNLLLVHMVKGGGNELKLLDPISVYTDDGRYTDEILKAYE